MGQRPCLGIIDSLFTGFQNIHHMLWILLMPVAMDVFLWRGPRLSVAPLTSRILSWLSTEIERMQAEGPEGEKALQSLEQLRQLAGTASNDFNLFSLLVLNIANLPSLAPGLAPGGTATWQVEGQALVGLALLLELGGLLLGCTYLGLIAQRVRDNQVDWRRLLGKVPQYWLSVVGFLACALGAIIVVGLPLGLVVGLITLALPPAGWLLLLVGQAAVFAALIFLFFLVDAIVVSEVGPFQAAANSVRVVSRYFWAALGLMVLVSLILMGTHVIWANLSRQSWGTLAGILGNAYVASGLWAATMIFYKDRLEALAIRPT